jgi:hypothetical protein
MHRIRELVLVLALGFGIGLSGAPLPGLAHATDTGPGKGKSVTLKGEIVDPQCWITHDGRGTAHTGCALSCAKAGQTLAFLDDPSGTLYMLLADNHSKNPNEPWYSYVGKPVIAKGDVFARGKLNAIVLRSVVVDRSTRPRP